MVRRLRQAGFSLIELMVVVAIMLLLGALASSLTITWTDSARVREANHRLLEGMGRLKALALANPGAISDDQASAVLVLAGQNLCVLQPPLSDLNCRDTAVWQTQVNAAVQLNGASSQCVALNSRALALPTQVGSVQCGTTLSYVISRGQERFPARGNNVLY